MPLGTLDRTPPPFFKQGLPARTKLALCTALALFLMVADGRFQVAVVLREALAVALQPVQRVLGAPVQVLAGAGEYSQGLQAALQARDDAQAEQARLAEKAARADRLDAENRQLRELLEMRPRLAVRSRAAEVLHEAADPYSRKLFIDAGSARGTRLGAPVLTGQGVLGQVTRVFPLSAEVTLLADREAAIPVLNTRTQQRHAAFGGAAGDGAATMELRYVSGNADVEVGDLLHTSGLDGVYPPALPVARVVSVDRRVDSSFARVLLAPLARADAVRHVLVLDPVRDLLSAHLAGTAPAAAASGASAMPAGTPAASAAASGASNPGVAAPTRGRGAR